MHICKISYLQSFFLNFYFQLYLKSCRIIRFKLEKIIQSLFSNLWINLVAFERETAEISRYLVRKYKLKPFDSLHLATAIRMQVDYFNTTDTKMIKKLPQTVSYLPNYPKEVMIQEPFIRGYQPRLF